MLAKVQPSTFIIVKKSQIRIASVLQMDRTTANSIKVIWKVVAILGSSFWTKCYLEMTIRNIMINLTLYLAAFIKRPTSFIPKKLTVFQVWVKELESMFQIKNPFTMPFMSKDLLNTRCFRCAWVRMVASSKSEDTIFKTNYQI